MGGQAVFVDWAAGSPAGVATNVKKALPVQLRKTLNIINSKSVITYYAMRP